MNPLIQSPVTTPVDRSSNPNRIPKINSSNPTQDETMPGGYK